MSWFSDFWKELWKKIWEKINPNPEPEPEPEEPIPLDQVTWLHTNVKDWAVTSELRSVNVDSSFIHLDHSKAAEWPGKNINGTELAGNPWIFIQKDGQWYAATWEWLRPGQTRKNRSAVNGDHIKQNPFWDWSPVAGETYGFMVSGLARDGNRNVKERSNIVMFEWPN